MEAKELRIGNLVYYNGNHEEIGIVSEILKNDINKASPYKIGINHRLDIYYNIDNIKPIPLTEEWLLRFGFIVREKTISLNVGGELMRYAFYEEIREDKRICFVIYYSKRNVWTLDSITSNKETVYFNSVHQLQNLFFTNVAEELTLKT